MKKKIGLAGIALTAITTNYAQQETGIAKFSEGQNEQLYDQRGFK